MLALTVLKMNTLQTDITMKGIPKQHPITKSALDMWFCQSAKQNECEGVYTYSDQPIRVGRESRIENMTTPEIENVILS
ncbi:hypothetical protein DPMN_192297 [Dreissena polymorpha]|uniref:Uncharacterized protein n=1 Tax=Dreissena polymorpha TaxID=45954 RepID=A0A9D3Y4I1_DREPO|nr:hypothetical protein DPMN_192297 [Dreissena polymorpha]